MPMFSMNKYKKGDVVVIKTAGVDEYPYEALIYGMNNSGFKYKIVNTGTSPSIFSRWVTKHDILGMATQDEHLTDKYDLPDLPNQKEECEKLLALYCTCLAPDTIKNNAGGDTFLFCKICKKEYKEGSYTARYGAGESFSGIESLSEAYHKLLKDI